MKFDLHHFMSAKNVHWLSIFFICLFSLLIVKEWSSLRIKQMPVPAVSIVEEKIPSAQQDSFNAILNSSLFGVYLSSDLDDSTIKKSMLQVKVVGILFASHPANSQVIIRSANAEEKTYKIGDTIPGDAKIKRITASGVVVERHGTLESLSLLKNELTFEPVAGPLKED